MAVLPMQRITIYGMKKNRKAILEALQRRGVVDVTEIENDAFQKIDTSQSRAIFSKRITAAESAMEILKSYAPEKSGMLSAFEGRKDLAVDSYYSYVDDSDKIMQAINDVNNLSKAISEHKAGIIRREAQIESLKPWLSLDVPMSGKGSKYTASFAGVFSEDRTLESILADYGNALEKSGLSGDEYAVDIETVSRSPEQTCVFVVCLKKNADSIEEVLRSIGFAKPAFSPNTEASVLKKTLEEEIKSEQAEIAAKESKIVSYAQMRDKFKFTVDYYIMRVEKYEILGRIGQLGRTFVLMGYIPKKIASAFEAEITHKYDVAVEIDEVGEEETPPVLLSNNGFAQPVETVLATYAMPGKGEIDPTFVMSLFYYFLFGLMLSDAVYGLVMVLGCAFLLAKFKSMEPGMKKTMKMFLYCGISTTFWGVMFGGYCGDAIDVAATTFFGVTLPEGGHIIPPLWFEPVREPMRMLMFAFLIGIIHIFAGLGMKFYQCVKDGKFLDAVFDVVFWYLLVGGGIVYLLAMPTFKDMTGLSFTLPAVFGKAAVICVVIGAIGIVLTDGRSSKNWGVRLGKGLYGLYNVTGYLSDILSYSRLLALGLATGVIAQVFNQMGAMAGSGVVGAIVFILVFVVGHTLNLAINALGAYVHTNRLQFVEFFGKFYEGGGTEYKPFSGDTKFFKIKEDL
ncbi:MAG: V-type ATP synthase subunit I [Oscillospiraceae bacterium]|nr:V-type ATP synthase subunit I [Oscillospiraceae bacterium]